MSKPRLTPLRVWIIRSGLSKITEARLRGDTARDQRHWALAAEQYQLHLQSRPRDFAIWVQLGHALKEAGRTAEALSAYQSALDLNPRDADLLLNMGHFHQQMNRPDMAKRLYQRSVAIDNNSAARAELSRLSGRPETPGHGAEPGQGPITSLEGSGRPPKSRARTRGNRARDRTDWTTAAEHYQIHLRDHPGDFAIWVQLGHAQKEAGRLLDALTSYSEANRIDAYDADLLLNTGHLHRLRGDRQNAIDFYRRSLDIDGNARALAALQDYGAAPDSAATAMAGSAKAALSATDASRALPPMSIVLPTFGPWSRVKDILARCDAIAQGQPLDYVILTPGGAAAKDAGAISDLLSQRDDVTCVSATDLSPGAALNQAIRAARHDIVLFMSGDIVDIDPQLFERHARFHALRPSETEAMIGRNDRRDSPDFPAGVPPGQAQTLAKTPFETAPPDPYRWHDWRYFRLSNLSLKKALLGDWATSGFSDAFEGVAIAGLDLAYRLSQQKRKLAIFHDPLAHCDYADLEDAEALAAQQSAYERMAGALLERRPAMAAELKT